MKPSLNDKNRSRLVLVVLVNVAVYIAVLSKGFAVEEWVDVLPGVPRLVPALLVSILTGIINAQVDSNNKARLVFWKWRHPLPGSRAFTEYANTDSRIDSDTLKKHQDPLPTNPRKQNALWFKWYQECQDEPSILQVHREYLFTRDYAAISFLLLLGFGSLALWQTESINVAVTYISILAVQYLLVRRAASNHGVRFVTSVMANKTSR